LAEASVRKKTKLYYNDNRYFTTRTFARCSTWSCSSIPTPTPGWPEEVHLRSELL